MIPTNEQLAEKLMGSIGLGRYDDDSQRMAKNAILAVLDAKDRDIRMEMIETAKMQRGIIDCSSGMPMLRNGIVVSIEELKCTRDNIESALRQAEAASGLCQSHVVFLRMISALAKNAVAAKGSK